MDKVIWKNFTQSEVAPYESKLLKLNCDKALHYLNWCAIWDFDRTIKETAEWYKTYYEHPTSLNKKTNKQINDYQNDSKKYSIL